MLLSSHEVVLGAKEDSPTHVPPHCRTMCALTLQVINTREPKCHVTAGASKRHVSGVKLQSVDGSGMFAVQHGHLHPTLSAPNMNSPVLWTNHDKLWVRSEAGLQVDAFTVVVARKSVKHRSIESIQDTNGPSICRDENLLPVVAEFESSPVTCTMKPCLKAGKRTLVKSTEVVQLKLLWVHPCSKYQPIRVKRTYRSPQWISQTLTVWRAQVPDPDRLIQGTRDKCTVNWWHGESNNLFRVT